MLYHYAHSSGTQLVGIEKNLPQLIHATYSKQKLAISGIKPLPKDVDRLVAIFHNDGHYILVWEFQFSVSISGTPIGSGIPIPFLIPEIPVGFLFEVSC